MSTKVDLSSAEAVLEWAESVHGHHVFEPIERTTAAYIAGAVRLRQVWDMQEVKRGQPVQPSSSDPKWPRETCRLLRNAINGDNEEG